MLLEADRELYITHVILVRSLCTLTITYMNELFSFIKLMGYTENVSYGPYSAICYQSVMCLAGPSGLCSGTLPMLQQGALCVLLH